VIARAPTTQPHEVRPDPAALLRLEDVARLLDIHLRTIKEWRASGRLRVLVFGLHCVRVEPSEIERLKREARR
jgi:predicted site-specific integrase-resolvase